MLMYIFEIIKPGTWLDYDDRDWSWEIENILLSMQGQFYEANLALNMFIQTISHDRTDFNREQREADANRRSEISREIEATFENPYDHNNWEEIYFRTEVAFKKEQWQAGRMPREFEHNQPFIYARTFLYALDSFDKFLVVLKSQSNIPEKVIELHKQLGDTFPDLRGVRNTAHHMEDRSRGLDAKGNPIELKPIDNKMIKADGGALVLNCLNGTKYGNTMADGHYGEVDVCLDSMSSLRDIFQAVLDSFRWKGLKTHLPSL